MENLVEWLRKTLMASQLNLLANWMGNGQGSLLKIHLGFYMQITLQVLKCFHSNIRK